MQPLFSENLIKREIIKLKEDGKTLLNNKGIAETFDNWNKYFCCIVEDLSIAGHFSN